MKKLFLVLLGVGLLAAKDDAGEKPPKPRFPLGKETTYVTEPLDADGYIDYAAALNERLRRGVTPANNANVLLWKVFGPHPERANMPADFFKWMDMEPPPEHGDYFVSLIPSVREQLKVDSFTEKDTQAIYHEEERCSQRSWKAAQYPNIAGWLKANEKPLALVLQATRRTHYYSPLIPKKTDRDAASRWLSAPMHGVQTCRELASALVARAMLRAGEGCFDDAWQDLLACHRLGRLVARGATMIELLIGIAIERFAVNTDLAFLEIVDWNAERIKNCLRELRELPPMPPVADKVDLGERFMYLDFFEVVDRDGMEALEGKASNPLAKFFQPSINWERALRNGNRCFDRMAKAMREKDRDTREKELGRIRKEFDALERKIGRSKPGVLQLLFGKDSDKIAGENVGNIFLALLERGIRKAQDSADRHEQQQHNLYLAFALAAYHRDHGRYPKELAALAPKYLDNIPKDIFSGEPLVYRPTANGYLLYSVGINGQDEEGRGSHDDPPGDDLTVRMPLPKLTPK